MTWGETTAIAALLVSMASAAFAFFAPIRAERLKRETAQRERELNCFSILMAERGRWGTPAMLAALNAVKVIFRDSHDILDSWFICYSKVGTAEGSVDQYNDLLALQSEDMSGCRCGARTSTTSSRTPLSSAKLRSGRLKCTVHLPS